MVHGGIGEAAHIRGTDQRTRQAALEPVSFLLNLSRYLYKIKICDIISRYLMNIGGTEYEGSL